MNKTKYGLLLAGLLLYSSCTVEPPEISNPVTWYAVNGWNSSVAFDIRDRVCNRQLPKVRLARGEEIQITSCGDENGIARIRYRRDSYQMAWSTGTARNGQRLQMQ